MVYTITITITIKIRTRWSRYINNGYKDRTLSPSLFRTTTITTTTTCTISTRVTQSSRQSKQNKYYNCYSVLLLLLLLQSTLDNGTKILIKWTITGGKQRVKASSTYVVVISMDANLHFSNTTCFFVTVVMNVVVATINFNGMKRFKFLFLFLFLLKSQSN